MSAKDLPVDEFESAIFAAELGDAPTLDLHGMDRSIALSELETFFHRELMQNSSAIKIIHGRGNQILRQMVIEWLKKPAQTRLVGKFRDSSNPAEQGAVTYVALQHL